jgi:hypothetical protein
MRGTYQRRIFMRQFLAALVLFQALMIPLAHADVRAYVDRPNIWTLPTIYVDGEATHRNFFIGFSDLAENMKSNPEAASFAERACDDKMWSSIFLVGGLGASLTYAIVKGGTYNAGTFWGLFALGVVPGVAFNWLSGINLNKAINSYNGVGAKATTLVPDKILLSPIAGGGIAGLGWGF